MKEILLTQGHKTQVDDEDFDYLNKWSWAINEGNGGIYAYRVLSINNNKYGIFMHNEILINRMNLTISKGYKPDHRDRNTLNNQRYNLRVITHSMNSHNMKIPKNNTSGHLGVGWMPKLRLWRARITINHKELSLGYFYTFDEAVAARRKAELYYFGEIFH